MLKLAVRFAASYAGVLVGTYAAVEYFSRLSSPDAVDNKKNK